MYNIFISAYDQCPFVFKLIYKRVGNLENLILAGLNYRYISKVSTALIMNQQSIGRNKINVLAEDLEVVYVFRTGARQLLNDALCFAIEEEKALPCDSNGTRTIWTRGYPRSFINYQLLAK